jgi:hypothetical protein
MVAFVGFIGGLGWQFLLQFSVPTKLPLHVLFIMGSGTVGHTCRHMSRNRIEIYWKKSETAPEGVIELWAEVGDGIRR